MIHIHCICKTFARINYFAYVKCIYVIKRNNKQAQNNNLKVVTRLNQYVSDFFCKFFFNFVYISNAIRANRTQETSCSKCVQFIANNYTLVSKRTQWVPEPYFMLLCKRYQQLGKINAHVNILPDRGAAGIHGALDRRPFLTGGNLTNLWNPGPG